MVTLVDFSREGMLLASQSHDYQVGMELQLVFPESSSECICEVGAEAERLPNDAYGGRRAHPRLVRDMTFMALEKFLCGHSASWGTIDFYFGAGPYGTRRHAVAPRLKRETSPCQN